MKKIALSLVAVISLGVSSLSAYEYQIQDGDQMLGAVVDIQDMTQFNNACVNYLYHVDYANGGNIKLHSANYNVSGYDELTTLNQGQGFILNATGNCNVTVVDPTIEFGDLKYKTITSPTTGKVWLDRNIGATEICSAKRDTFTSDSDYEVSQAGCFGGYYQWGRETDGHQLSSSLTTTTLKSNITGNDGRFVLTDDSNTYYDWLRKGEDTYGTVRLADWQSIDGSSICPVGFKVPNGADLEAEGANIDNFINVLKFPVSGFRSKNVNDIYGEGSYGSLWTTDSAYEKYPHSYNYNESTGYGLGSGADRATGRMVRCIKQQ
ncbi:MAG: hypothetical protein KAJ49_06480 [Arcobacteraceae bacterium]|nr:hypothetical protein [Arcobacteraceae bacterium]